MENHKLSKLIKSVVTIRQLDANGVCLNTQVTTNTLTYAAAGILLSALLKSGPSQITHLYARFGSVGTPGYLAATTLPSTVRADFLASADGDTQTGGLWVPILSAPIQETTDTSIYAGNKATFFFRIPNAFSEGQVTPANNFHLDTSKIFALGLGVAQNTAVRGEDVIISVLQAYGYDNDLPDEGYFTSFSIPENGQTAIDYVLQLEL